MHCLQTVRGICIYVDVYVHNVCMCIVCKRLRGMCGIGTWTTVCVCLYGCLDGRVMNIKYSLMRLSEYLYMT